MNSAKLSKTAMRGQILVLGVTGGVGQAVAQKLLAEGFEVIGSCRTAAQGRQMIEAGICTRTLLLRLDQSASIAAAFKKLGSLGITTLDGVVNCAAVTQPKPLELAVIGDVRQLFQINLFGALEVMQRALPLLRPVRGRIVLVSSTSGSIGVPLLGAYSASKFALEALADVLRRELLLWKIGVSLVIPGGIKTGMIDRQLSEIDAELAALKPGGKSTLIAEYSTQYRQHRTVIELAEKSAVPPSQVADDVLRALTDARPKARYLCGFTSKGTRTMRRMLPDAVLDQLFSYLPQSKK